jgi:hypothetical protein
MRLAHATSRLTKPVRFRIFRCSVIAGLDTPEPPVASPRVAGPVARRSTGPAAGDRHLCAVVQRDHVTVGI